MKQMNIKELKNIFVPYDSPIDVIYNTTVDNIMAAFNHSIDDGVVTAVVKAGFNVDKDKLVEVFTQDKRRYEEAYRKGYAQREADIIRCKDCKHYDSETQSCLDGLDGTIQQDWFCADGERKE